MNEEFSIYTIDDSDEWQFFRKLFYTTFCKLIPFTFKKNIPKKNTIISGIYIQDVDYFTKTLPIFVFCF